MSHLNQNLIFNEGDYYTDVNGYQIPQNIHHRFRSSKTIELLSDRNKVESDKNELEYINIKKYQPVYRRAQTTIPSTNPDYTKISNDLRCCINHGHPVQRCSHSKTVHNEQIFKDHQDDKQVHLYRRRKDWLARWTEANIIRDRLYKSILESQKKSSE